jgi:integrase
MSRDSGCRPHELLKLRIRDIVFRSTDSRHHQYAEVLVAMRLLIEQHKVEEEIAKATAHMV